jgi:outer membrane protein TolC
MTAELHAQMKPSLPSATELTVRNSSKIKLAEDDVRRAAARKATIRSSMIPSLMASTGIGASSGITLNIPTIFTASARSLVFDPSRQCQLRAAEMDIGATQAALQNITEQVEEDAVLTY